MVRSVHFKIKNKALRFNIEIIYLVFDFKGAHALKLKIIKRRMLDVNVGRHSFFPGNSTMKTDE